MNIQNHRLVGESATLYRHRRRQVAKLLKTYLGHGTSVTHSRDKSTHSAYSQWRFWGDQSAGKPRKYVNGPHRSHKPHEVKQEGMVLGPAGAPRPHTWTVMHPGTLVKALVA